MENTYKCYIHNLCQYIHQKESRLTVASVPTLSPEHTGVIRLIAPTQFPPDTLPCKNKNTCYKHNSSMFIYHVKEKKIQPNVKYIT